PPYTWSFAGGILPPGLTLSAARTVTGKPTSAGTFLTTISVQDSSTPPLSITSQVAFTVVNALTIATTALPNATTGAAYYTALFVQGGTQPYSFSLESGSLPTGLVLNGCIITGTPSAQGVS